MIGGEERERGEEREGGEERVIGVCGGQAMRGRE